MRFQAPPPPQPARFVDSARHTPRRYVREREGVALIVVLAFIVLITGLMVAFFSRAMTSRQLSNSSVSQTKSAVLARSATDTVIAGFKQEIVNGSTSAVVGSGSNYTTVYAPKQDANTSTGQYAAPIRYPANDAIPNLVRESKNDENSTTTNLRGVAVSSQASAVNSTQNPAIGGRTVTLARWNSHYLVPRYNAPANAPSTPDSFSAPDWVLVNRAGPAVVPNIAASFDSSLANSVNNSTSTNQNYVVGRYAYAVYDEGGLLDMNVAGYPILAAPTPTPASTGLTSTQVGGKSSLALADLTQLPIVKSPSSPDPTKANAKEYLSAADVNGIIGWRNYAAAGANGNYPISSFTADQASNWFTNFAKNNTAGFLKAYGGPQGNTDKTDQAFLSRQQLIKLQSSLGFSANALQYMGTFSRSLEQPAFQPDSKRPTIQPTTVPPDISTNHGNITTYYGNNNYAGGDAAINFVGVPGGLLSVRVGKSFTRLDGSTAVVGEPLVKRRFALSRLALVTSSATANKTDSDPIYARFGLYRSDATVPWVYDHGASSIMTLTQVAAQNREPDMAELLKAAINVGSVGKATYTNQGNDLEYTYDVSGDRQILQIMANLIDQTKSDNYPTRIQPFSNAKTALAVIGVQDLPYFYNWHYFNLTTRIPSPLLSSSDTVGGFPGPPDPKTGNPTTLTPDHIKKTELADAGAASCLIIPQIWNPHDANTLPAPGGGPTKFRVVAETTDPTGTLKYWNIQASPAISGESFDGSKKVPGLDPPDTVKSAYTTLSMPATDFSDSALMFTDSSGGKAFREPTLLWRDGLPAGVTISGTSRTEDKSLTGKKYYGILVGDTSLSWTATITDPNSKTNPPEKATYVCQSSTLHKGTSSGPSGSSVDDITFRMQYKDSQNNWITYQNAYVEALLPLVTGYPVSVNASEPAYDAKQYMNPLQSLVNNWGGTQLSCPRGGPYDPRTPRFASPVCGWWDTDDKTKNGNPTLDAVTMKQGDNNNGSTKFKPGENEAVANSNFVLMATQRPTTSRGQNFAYTNPGQGYMAQMGWFSASNSNNGGFYGGLMSQNDPMVKVDMNSALGQDYYEDPDGVCRRAMGAYATRGADPATSSRTTSTTSPVGLPMVTSASSFSGGIGTSTAKSPTTTQSQSRPIILHRPFTSVAEMGVAFRGTPWKSIDFFTPESGDTALLDVFCVNEPPADSTVAGKVNLNTQQAPVLQAILAGAYRDELTTNQLPALSNTEAANVASVLVDITSNTSNKVWRGPLTNIADLVGHFVNTTSTVAGSDVYQYTSNKGGTKYTYAGLSAALGGKTPSGSIIWDNDTNTAGANTNDSTLAIQRFREAAIRPLASCGQTRVWNLMIDVVAQAGRYPQSSTSLAQFSVDGETRYWVHVAIDRVTGQVIDKQVEIVAE